jgi:hypothetical protein
VRELRAKVESPGVCSSIVTTLLLLKVVAVIYRVAVSSLINSEFTISFLTAPPYLLSSFREGVGVYFWGSVL